MSQDLGKLCKRKKMSVNQLVSRSGIPIPTLIQYEIGAFGLKLDGEALVVVQRHAALDWK